MSVARLVELLGKDLVGSPALRAVGNMVTGNTAQTQGVIDAGALPVFKKLLLKPLALCAARQRLAFAKEANSLQLPTDLQEAVCAVLPVASISVAAKAALQAADGNEKLASLGTKDHKEIAWTLSNITAGTKEQIQSVIDVGLIPVMINLLTSAATITAVKKEAAWVITNATTGGTAEQIRYLVISQRCLRPLCDLLAVGQQDSGDKDDTSIQGIVDVALEGIENILKLGEESSKSTAVSTSTAALAETGTEMQSAGPAPCLNENEFCRLFEEVDGLRKLQALTEHADDGISERAAKVLEHYSSNSKRSLAEILEEVKILPPPTNKPVSAVCMPQLRHCAATSTGLMARSLSLATSNTHRTATHRR